MILFIILFSCYTVFCQSYIWTWIEGSTDTGQTGSYTSVNVYPGARGSTSGAIHPTSGDFVVFGGFDSGNYFNDLWTYSFDLKQWTWLDGSSTPNSLGRYGTKGTASSNNMPGARNYHTIDIHPTTGILYLFGGFGYDISSSSDGSLNDLWAFNFATNQWAWISGMSSRNQYGSYLSRGVSSTGYPGGRDGHSMHLLAQKNSIVVFGGFGYASSGSSGFLNDLWSFDITSSRWTWIAGSSGINQASNFGSIGVPTSTTTPGARTAQASTINPTNGNLIIFGGFNNNRLNDLWSFNFETSQWTWISGTSSSNRLGIYGTRGVSFATNMPGGRSFNRMAFSPETNSLLMFGGYGYDGATSTLAYLNDVWVYSFTSNQWTWVAGSRINNQVGSYGTKGVFSASNSPGSRQRFEFVYSSITQKFILFSGYGYGAVTGIDYLNDLWILDLVMPVTSSTGIRVVSTPVSSTIVSRTSSTAIRSLASSTILTSSKPYSVFKSSTSSSFGFTTTLMSSKPIMVLPSSTTSRTTVLTNLVSPTLLLVASNPIAQASRANSLSSNLIRQSSQSISSSFAGSVQSLKSDILSITPSAQPVELISTMNQHGSGGSNEVSVRTSTLNGLISINLVDIPDQSRFIRTAGRGQSGTAQNITYSMSNFFSQNLIAVVVVLILFTTLCILFVIFLIKRYKRKVTKRATSIRSENSQTAIRSMFTNTTMNSTAIASTFTTVNNTMVRTDQAIFIPGFLWFKMGHDFRVDAEIARGGFGSVHLGKAFEERLKVFGDTIIIKIMNNSTAMSEKEIALFYQEVSIMHFLREKRNIAKLLGYCEQPFCILMKFYDYGSLDRWIHTCEIQKTKLSIVGILNDVSSGLEAMHTTNLVHCDLKPQNILLDWDARRGRLYALLSDFGLTQIVSWQNLLVQAFRVINIKGISLAFAAPEAIRQMRTKSQVPGGELLKFDIYSLAVIIFEIITRRKAWNTN